MNRVFISYSGSRIERSLLFHALQDHGLNPWRDVESQNLGDATTEVIEEKLAGSSAAILWINRDIFHSHYVATVELPAIARAWRKGLRVVPVFDGMSPSEAADELSGATGIEIGDTNGHLIDSSLAPEDSAAEIGRRVVRAHVEDAAKRGEEPTVRLVSYDDTAALREQAVLNLDWRHRLTSSSGLEPSDESRLRDALSTAAGAFKDAYGAGEIAVAAKTHLPFAVALGHAFAQPSGCTLGLDRGSDEPWVTTRPPRAPTPPLVEANGMRGPVQARSASLEASITRNVEAGVNRHVSRGQRYRHRLMLTPPEGPSRTAFDQSEIASAWAYQIATALMRMADRSDIDNIDLFLAAPVEVAIFIGWWANSSGTVNLMHWNGERQTYERMWTIP